MTTDTTPSTGDRTAHRLNLQPLDAIPCDGEGCAAVATRLVARSVYPPIDDYVAEQTPSETRYRSMRLMLCEECCRKAMGWPAVLLMCSFVGCAPLGLPPQPKYERRDLSPTTVVVRPEPEFAFGDKVRVKSGFYAGWVGWVADFDELRGQYALLFRAADNVDRSDAVVELESVSSILRHGIDFYRLEKVD